MIALKAMAVVSDIAAMFAPMVLWMSQSSILPASFSFSNLRGNHPRHQKASHFSDYRLLCGEGTHPAKWDGSPAFAAKYAKGACNSGKRPTLEP